MTNKILLSEVIDDIKNERTCDYVNDFCDYSGSTYICDAIQEMADGYVDIYNSDLVEWFAENWDMVDEAIAEFGKADSIMRDIQSRQYLYHSNAIYEELETDIKLYAYYYLKDTLGVEEIDEASFDDMETELERIDNNNRFSDIEDIAEKHSKGSGMFRLMKAWNEYNRKEFDSEPMAEAEAVKDGLLGVCYTTVEGIEEFGLEDDYTEIQVSYDLDSLTLNYWADGFLVRVEHFGSIDDIAEDIENADFQAYYGITLRAIEHMLQDGGLVVKDGLLALGNPEITPENENTHSR